jgi:hypothetical protein
VHIETSEIKKYGDKQIFKFIVKSLKSRYKITSCYPTSPLN